MIAIMQKAIKLDEDDFEIVKKDRENISRLIEENRGLREVLEISHKFGNGSNDNGNHESKSETEKLEKTEKISVETQTDTNANKC